LCQGPEVDTPVEDVTEVDPEPEVEDNLDIGASVIEDEDGSIEIELGDDETGSIAAIKVEEFTRNVDEFPVFSLGVYLVPEGVTLPVNPAGDGDTYSSPGNFAEAFGLTLLTEFDLGTLADHEDLANEANTLTDPPEITSDEPITILSTYFGNPNQGGGGLFFSSNVAETLSPFESITPNSAA
jgi:hypothetical protein|tara:strand:+ start:999 stop:1547 length:549 start_codon:yes stop_codon:yes gene_type:complete